MAKKAETPQEPTLEQIAAGSPEEILAKLTELTEENTALREAIAQLKKENASAAKQPSRYPAIKFDGAVYFVVVRAFSLPVSKGKITAEAFAENALEKYKADLEFMIKRNSGILKKK